MTRRIKRTSDFELQLSIGNDQFIQTPRQDQRNWMLNRVMRETSEELNYLNHIAPDFIKGSESPVSLDREQQSLVAEDIMEDWQIPVMKAMASSVARSAGDVLEVGMGRGIASGFIQEHSPRSHTLVECNNDIANEFPAWRAQYPNSDVNLLHDLWQNCLDETHQYDGILFHTYPLTEQDFVDQVVNSVTFAEHFFELASKMMRPGGAFTYLTNEIDSLSRAHQRALFHHFDSFSLTLIKDLNIPENTRDSLWSQQIVHVVARKCPH